MTRLRVLVSGASVAGPVAALWLSRQGCDVTVVERMPLTRVRTGGHAVDLFGPAMDVLEWAGVLPAVLEARTATEVVSFERQGGRGVDLDMSRLVGGISSRHVEVMRGELAGALYDATRAEVTYLFEDSVTALTQSPAGVEVTFGHAAPARFDLVLGADGLHSTVRRLAFGDESRFRRYLGGYLAIFVLPDYLQLGRRMRVHNEPGRLAAVYPVRGSGTARAGFLFRRDIELTLDPLDVAGQKAFVRELYGRDAWQTPRLLEEMDASEDFYFDSISQIVMDTWSTGRVGLVGDAAYSSGPAVGGGTSLAVVGAYLLAQQVARAGGDVAGGLRAYDEGIRGCAEAFRRIGPSTMQTLIPRTAVGTRAAPYLMKALSALPDGLVRRLGNLQATPARALSSVRLAPPAAISPRPAPQQERR